MTETIEIAAQDMVFTAERAGPDDGALVLCLHGFPNSRHSWQQQMSALAAAGYRAVAPDQRGYSTGAQPEGIAAYHADHLVSDVIALADVLGADRFHLVGHDWGGQIAWLTASAHPDRLKSLSVLSRPHPAAFARAMEADPAQARRSGHHKAFQDLSMAHRMLEDNAMTLRNTLCFENARGFFGTGEGDQGKRRMSDAMADKHLSVLGHRKTLDSALNWYRAATTGGSNLARADMPAITVPTLFVWGTEDSTVGRMAAEGTADCISAPFQFIEIDGAGHFLAEEVPDQVNKALLAHLEAHA